MDAKDKILDLFKAYDFGTDLGRAVVSTDYDDLADEIVSVLFPEGWVLMPRVLTEEMLQAGYPADTAQEGFDAVIAARPELPE